jgi:hypothetical protein
MYYEVHIDVYAVIVYLDISPLISLSNIVSISRLTDTEDYRSM